MKKKLESASQPGGRRVNEAEAEVGGSANHLTCTCNTSRCKEPEPRTQRFLSIKSVSQQLDVTPNTISRWVRNGKFPAPVRISGTTRWREQDLIDFEKKVAG